MFLAADLTVGGIPSLDYARAVEIKRAGRSLLRRKPGFAEPRIDLRGFEFRKS